MYNLEAILRERVQEGCGIKGPRARGVEEGLRVKDGFLRPSGVRQCLNDYAGDESAEIVPIFN